MIKTIILEKKSLVLTPKELRVIKKKLSGAKMNQQDSNYLSRYIRPKLKEIKEIDAKLLLEKLEYNQKGLSIEKKIINNLKYLKPKAIILFEHRYFLLLLIEFWIDILDVLSFLQEEYMLHEVSILNLFTN